MGQACVYLFAVFKKRTSGLKQDRWQDENGQKHSRIDVVANAVQFTGSRDDNQSAGSYQNTAARPAPAAAPAKSPAQPAPENIDFENFEDEPLDSDEVPF